MQYRFYWKVWVGNSESYYYDGLRLKLLLDGAEKDITVKGYNNNEMGWSYSGTTEWYTVYNKSSGTTAFYAQLYDTNTNTTKVTSSTYQLSVIASQATIVSATDFNDEQNPTITYSNPAGASVTKLQACISFDGSKDDIAYRDVPKTGNSYVFPLTDAERTVLRNNTPKTSRKVFFYLKTVVGSTEYYDRVEKNLTIVNANPTFAASQVTYKDTNSATTAVTGNNQHIVQNKSVLSVTITAATAIKGATITSYVVSVNGMDKPLTTAGTIEFGTINANSDISISVKAIDSRGNSTPVYKTVTIIPYAEPTVEPIANYSSIVCKRCDTNGTLADDGTFLKLIVRGKWNTLTNDKNTASVKVKATYSGYDSGWVNVTATASGGGASNKYFKWYDINTKVAGLTLDATKAYTVTIRCIDAIGAYRDIPYTIPSADVALHLRKGGKGAAFGEYSQDENFLSVAEDWTFRTKGWSRMQHGYYVHSGEGTSGVAGYVKIAEIAVKDAYINSPIRFSIAQRGVRQNDVSLMFNGENSLDPVVAFFNYEGTEFTAYIGKITTSTWGIYIKKREAYDSITITEINIPRTLKDRVLITWCNNLVAESELPSTKTLCVQLYTDYVVAKGTSGIWTYQKWNSGAVELWGKYSFTMDKGEGVNYAVTDTIAHPFTLTSADNIQVSNSGGYLVAFKVDSVTTTGSKFLYWSRGDVGLTGVPQDLYIYIKGKWK